MENTTKGYLRITKLSDKDNITQVMAQFTTVAGSIVNKKAKEWKFSETVKRTTECGARVKRTALVSSNSRMAATTRESS